MSEDALTISNGWPADAVERRPIAELVPYARNARTHSDAQVDQIAASMREWGWTNPVLIDEQSGIIAGHGRILAAQKLGVTEAPCMVAAGWSESAKRAYVIADNKLALNAGWDEDMLALELSGVSEDGFDVSITGFDDQELRDLLGKAGEEDLPDLGEGGKETPSQMTFTVTQEQAEQVNQALEVAKGMGPFTDTGNENSNGNALARIAETFLTEHG